MSLELRMAVIPDPEGHNPALLLKGDWVFIILSDGKHVGIGEVSHSRDDRACIARIADLFEKHVRKTHISLDTLLALEEGRFGSARDLVTATAMSGLNQALFELLARREGIPVWRLFTKVPARDRVPLYATLNRALTYRAKDEYRQVTAAALGRGFKALKYAPFEAVTPKGDQVGEASYGLSVLEMIAKEFPDVSMRVDLHKRFTPENFIRILPELESIEPIWIEEPCPLGPDYFNIRGQTPVPIAAGELFFGKDEFVELAESGWADVVMPDVKHVGGFGPLLSVCRAVSGIGSTAVSPHNPSGPVGTLASVHAAAVSTTITSIEVPFHIDQARVLYAEYLDKGELKVPGKPGWGLSAETEQMIINTVI